MVRIAASHELGRLIKSARQSKKLTQANLGKLIGLTRDVIASIEAGRSGVRGSSLDKLIEWNPELTELINNKPSPSMEFDKPRTFSDALFLTFIDRAISERDANIPAVRSGEDGVISNCRNQNEMISCLGRLVLDYSRAGAGELDPFTIYWTARRYNRESIFYRNVANCAIPELLSKGHFVSHVITTTRGSERDAWDRVLLMVQLLKRYARWSNNYSCRLLTGVADQDLPIDLYYAGTAGHLASMSTTVGLQPTSGLGIHVHAPTIDAFCRAIRGSGQEVVILYDDPEKFIPSYAASENCDGFRYMVQMQLPHVTRPLEHYERDSPWYKRATARWGRERAEVIANHRRSAAASVAKRIARNNKIQTIVCSDTILSWIRTGLWDATQASNANYRKWYFEKEDERVERLIHLDEMLACGDNVEVAIVDKSRFDQLPGIRTCKNFQAAYVVQGHNSVVAEIIDPEVKDPERRVFQALIDTQHPETKCVSLAFQAEFESSWRALKPAERSKHSVRERVQAWMRQIE